jgi:hypothetical protein
VGDEPTCRLNIARVTRNVIIFTSLACVISHHNGPYHAKESRQSGPVMSVNAMGTTVRVRKKAIWHRQVGVGKLYQFGMVGAV